MGCQWGQPSALVTLLHAKIKYLTSGTLERKGLLWLPVGENTALHAREAVGAGGCSLVILQPQWRRRERTTSGAWLRNLSVHPSDRLPPGRSHLKPNHARGWAFTPLKLWVIFYIQTVIPRKSNHMTIWFKEHHRSPGAKWRSRLGWS